MLVSKKNFNNLKIHTQYSICEGAIKIDELADYCKINKIKSVGLADSFNLCGALEFSEKLSKVGTQPIIGTQINLKENNTIGKITLYAKTELGYKNLTKLSSLSYLKGNEIDELFRNRWRTLLSVDDLVTELYETIRTMNLLNSTYWIVTSDHGYNLGQHRLPSCKLNVYDHDTRIPLIISGPGISMNTKFDLLGSNVDVAPTMLSLAGASPDEISQHFDGKSILNVLDLDESVLLPWTRSSYVEHRENKTTWRDSHLIEYHSLGNVNRTGHLVDDNITNTYRALRFDKTSRYGDFLYVLFECFVSVYNLSTNARTQVR